MRETGLTRPRLLALAWTIAVPVMLWSPVRGGGGPPMMDKVVHFVMFTVLAALWMRALGRPRNVIALLALGLVYAGLTEGVQALLPYREADAWDLVANAAGLVMGIVATRQRVEK